MLQTNKKQLSIFLLLWMTLLVSTSGFSINPTKYISNQANPQHFPLASKASVAPLLLSENDHKGVLRVAQHLQTDLQKVTSIKPQLFRTASASSIPRIKLAVIIGTLGQSVLIDQLASQGKIDGTLLEGKWEKFTTQIVEHPFPNIERAVVIAGSDKRGTIYGMYDLSNQIGVSPWYYWADVPIKKQTELHVLQGIHTNGEPKVKYRGIFINDEAPALTNWARQTFGGFNAQFYDKVFELILRNKGNYLWPAMWKPAAFAADDPENPRLADEYGIVIATSHHEPMMRAHAEWNKDMGAWNYHTNKAQLQAFWKGGLERMGNHESVITLGMRGDGDEALSEETAVALLENIVADQRKIIAEVTQKPAKETPQVWALYKEVMDYYDKGMQVPDDVTLLLCDDNWGDLRKLPPLNAPEREGGYGIYYHFDYVGGPRNYKWLNANQIERTWEQMNLAYEHGVDEIWIVNVGDIKPVEFPMQFFLDFAWNPEYWTADRLNDYYLQWCNENFGEERGAAIVELLKKYTKYNTRRKPELLKPSTYSLIHYNEANRVVKEYNALAEKAEAIYQQLPPDYKDAFYQLIWYPVIACANLNELYVTAAKNQQYAQQGRAMTNAMAGKVQALFDKDSLLTLQFHTELANGKWNHMMSQTHIGYTYWNSPPHNNMPKTETIDLPSEAKMGIAVEGDERFWTTNTNEAELPTFEFYNNPTYSFEIFNRGAKAFKYKIKSKDPWIKVARSKGKIKTQEKFNVRIDWENAPIGNHESQIIIKGAGEQIPIQIKIDHHPSDQIRGFVEHNGYISIAAPNFSTAYTPDPFQWKIIDNLGRTGSSVISLPIKKGRIKLDENTPKISYDVHFKSKGKVKVHLHFSPTLNYAAHRKGMLYALSFDGENPQIIDYDTDPMIFNYNGKVPSKWEKNVGDAIKVITTEFEIKEAGNHTLHYYRIDEGLVLQHIVIETTEQKPSYFAPPESAYLGK